MSINPGSHRAFRLGHEDKGALREYWRFFEPRGASIAAGVRTAISRLPAWQPVIERLTPERLAEQDTRSRALQRQAILEDHWEPYLVDLRGQGTQYARLGIGYADWFDVITAYRDTVGRELVAHLHENVDENMRRATTISQGMNCMLDISIETIGEAYIAEKEQLASGSEERYRSMFEHSPLPMWTFDRSTLRFVAVNDAAIRHYGYSRDEFLQMTLEQIRPADDVPAMRTDVQDVAGTAEPKTWRHCKKDGSLIDVEIKANDFAIGGAECRLVLVSDVTERNRAHAELRKTEDQLRHAQKMDADREEPAPVRPAANGSPSRPRVLVADDDEAMRRVVARTLRKIDCDVVAVDDGGKAIAALEQCGFDVVISDVHMPETGGLDVLKAIRRVDLDVPVILMSGEPDVASAVVAIEHGAYRYLTKPLDFDALGRTVVVAARAHALARLRREAFSLSGAPAGASDRAGLEVRFDQALERMWVAFQPIVDAKTGAVFGVEALMRSDEPTLPSPPAILDAATQLGRLPALGRRVRALAAQGMSASSATLFVNLHPDDIMDVDLVDELAPLTRIASRVVLEVTERASLDSSPRLSERLARLRKLGFRLAVDDIGAGYSGLTSFTELMPEVVKIDLSLVRDVHLSALKQRTISALCKLCHEVGCLVVGEGVETSDERDCLVGLGCDLLQGYLIGRPGRDLPTG